MQLYTIYNQIMLSTCLKFLNETPYLYNWYTLVKAPKFKCAHSYYCMFFRVFIKHFLYEENSLEILSHVFHANSCIVTSLFQLGVSLLHCRYFRCLGCWIIYHGFIECWKCCILCLTLLECICYCWLNSDVQNILNDTMPEFRTHNSKRLVSKKKKKGSKACFCNFTREWIYVCHKKKKTFITLLLVPLPKMKIHELGDAAL